MGDESGTRLLHVRRVGFQPDLDRFQLECELLLGSRLALLPLVALMPDCPPPAPYGAGRVDGNPALQLEDLATTPGGRPAVPARENRAPARAGGFLARTEGLAALAGAGYGDSVGISTIAAGA